MSTDVSTVKRINEDSSTDLSVEKITEYFDIESGLKVKSVQVIENEQMGSMVMSSTFSDYKEVSGMKFAFQVMQQMGPQQMDMKVASVEVNTKIPDSAFE